MTISQEQVLAARNILNGAFNKCVASAVSVFKSNETDSMKLKLADTYSSHFTQSMSAATPRGETFISNLAGDKQYKDLPDSLKRRCMPGDLEGGIGSNEELIQIYGNPADERALISAITGDAPTYFIGVDATIGETKFKFLDRAAFKIEDTSKTGVQASAFGGVIGGSGAWSLRGGYSYSRSHSASSNIEFCRPAGVVGTIECLLGGDGPPDRKSRHVVSIEGRKVLDLGKIGSRFPIGIAPEFSYDFKNDDYQLDVPIYLASDKEGRLTGGVRTRYTNSPKKGGGRKDDLEFGIFVGIPFSIFR